MDPILTGAAANNSSEAAKGILQEVKRHFRCVTTYKKNVDKFEEKRVKDLEEKAKNKCFIGLCPSIKSRYQLSRRAEKGATALEGLIQKHQFTGSEATDDEPVKDFEAFESRQKVFNDIMEAVKDTSTSMIGLYGIGGAGKSTLLKEIVRQVKKSKLFDCVVSLAIKDIPAIMTIQDQIAELLGLEWKGSTVIARELRLEDGKLLVVLDDLREKLNLKGMGIPFGEEPKRFKILVASRDQDVLRQCEGMYDQNNTFSIGCLDDNDASDLFKKIVGGSINPELQAIGDEIAKRCGGLPLAISAVAQTLRNKNQPAWENALSQLQSPSSTGLKDVSPAVYAALKLCYNHIEGDEVKRFFLLCSLLSHDFLIEVLLRYAIGLGLLPSDYTVEEARDRMSRWVRNLKASGLLLDSYSDDRIDMHDIICDVAISIASEENNHVLALKQEDALKDWPSVETIKWHSWIDLSVSSYTVLPDVVECPQLSFLHISGQYRSTKVPHDFFKEMKMLQVLDLTDMNLSSFPSSIGLLSSLQTLCLHQSELGDITVVGELKALEILSLWNSVIEKLPEEIGHLLKLKVLDLRGCTKLKIIPPGLISRLTKLEELYMGDSFAEWEVEVDVFQRSNASLNELSSLSHLAILEVHIRDAKMVPGNFFIFQKLKKYKIFIGDEWTWSSDSEYSSTLKLQFQTYASIDQLHLGIKMLLQRTEDLYVDKVKGVKIALQEFIDEKGFPNLKNLHVQNGLEIQYIILDGIATPINLRSLTLKDLPKLISFSLRDEKGSASKTQHLLFGDKMVLPCLEKLQISRVNVERIWDDKLSDRNQKLTRLIIEGCDKLKHLLSASMARSLVHLKYFEVVGCKSLRDIISREDISNGDKAPILFPQLNSLKMGDLKLLRGFCSENTNIDLVCLKLLKIESCPEFKGFIYNPAMDEENPSLSSQALFNKQVVLPNLLEDLTISDLDNLERIWDDQQAADSFCNLEDLVVKNCKKLLVIFPFNMSGRLQKLRRLVIEQCDLVEEIIEAQGLDDRESDVVTTTPCDIVETVPKFEFPQLTFLRLSELPKLRSFHGKIHTTKWPSLEKVSVFECRNLERIFASISEDNQKLKDRNEEEEEEERQLGIQFQPLFWTSKDAFPCLKELGLDSNANLRDIWLGQLPPNYTSLPSDKLQRLWHDQLPELSCYFLNLKVLQVEGCNFLNYLFPFSVAENFVHLESLKISGCDKVKEVMVMDKFVEQGRIIMVFPRLKEISMWGLSKVMRFCNGNCIEFPILHTLSIQECPELTTFVADFVIEDESQVDPNMGKNNSEVDVLCLFNDKVSFPGLCKLDIYASGKFWQKIWHDKLAPNSFGNLVIFKLEDCNRLSSIFSMSMVDRLVNLQNMDISNCENLEWIIEPFGLTYTELSSAKVVFPLVTSLRLVYLPRLRSFDDIHLPLTQEAFPLLEKRNFESDIDDYRFFLGREKMR